MSKKLLCLSNGHGEDAIAVSILKQLSDYGVEIEALPLVGKGIAYNQQKIPLIAPTEILPSGGFIYMDGNQLWQDVQGGLLGLSVQQFQAVKKWVQQAQDHEIGIIAVGDILPLFLAWMTGVNYAFVGTAKSDYYLRNQQGWLKETNFIQRRLDSIYYPWERWLMQSPRCLGIYPRDSLTAQILKNYSLRVFDYGNPMMDVVDNIPMRVKNSQTLTILLLPGSRFPEAESNWKQILQGVDSVIDTIPKSLLFLGAIAPTVDLNNLVTSLVDHGWETAPEISVPFLERNTLLFKRKKAILALTQQQYSLCLIKADLAIAMSGTATEQFVGLGKPAIAIPGNGPQYTLSFARAQKRLLGCSLILVENPQNIGSVISSVYQDDLRLDTIATNGKQRMGQPGASRRIAENLSSHFFSKK